MAGELRGVQCLRFIAAAMVVLLHANNRTGLLHAGYDNRILKFLEAGVDIFFVISGFIMVYTIRVGTTPAQFAWNRFVRIVPLYWLCTIAAFALSAYPAMILKTGPDTTILAYSMAFLPKQAMLPVGWTLNFEMAFYALIAVGLFFGRYWLVVPLTAIVGCIAMADYGFPVSYYANRWLILEFLVGISIAIFVKHARINLDPVHALLIALVGFTLLPVAGAFTHLGIPRGMCYGGVAGLIVFGSIYAEPLFRKGWATPFVFLGAASYSIYLVHILVQSPAAYSLKHLTAYANASKAFSPNATLWMLFILGLSAGILVHVLVETPLLRFLRQIAANKRSIASGFQAQAAS